MITAFFFNSKLPPGVVGTCDDEDTSLHPAGKDNSSQPGTPPTASVVFILSPVSSPGHCDPGGGDDGGIFCIFKSMPILTCVLSDVRPATYRGHVPDTIACVVQMAYYCRVASLIG